MGERRHFRLHEAAHFGAHLVERVVEAAVADGERPLRRTHDLDQPGAGGGGIAVLHEDTGPASVKGCGIVMAEAEVGQAGEFLLVHRDAAGDLGQVFAKRDLDEKLLGLAEPAGLLEPLGVAREAAQGLGVGDEPGQRMQPVLLGVDHPGHVARHRGAGPGENVLDRAAGLAGRAGCRSP